MISSDIEKNISAKSGYRPEIDGLRAFGVTSVIINHFNKDILPGGYLGVDIFFVISGFVITSSLYQRNSNNFKDFISGFYERRIKRLVPALSVFVIITSFTICLFNPNPILTLRTGLTSLFGLSNLYLLKQSTNYFAEQTQFNAFTHTWSLGVEEQFYILFPFIIWFSGFARHTKNGVRNLFLIVASLSIVSLIGFVYLYSMNQPAAYFLMPPRFWEMASGCLLFIGFQKSKYIIQFLEKVPPVLLLTMIIAVMYLPLSLAITSTFAVVVLTLLLIASLKKGKKLYTFFSNPKVVFIGLISYSLYLWHWGVLAISRWTIGIHWWSVPFQVALMFGLAVVSFRYIETPFREWKWFGKQWKKFLVEGGIIIVTISGVLITLEKPLRRQLYLGDDLSGLEESNLTTPYKIDGFEGLWNGRDCVLTSNFDVKKKIKLEQCTLGKPEISKTQVLVIGNSFSASFVHGFDDLVKSKKYTVTITSSWGASPVPEIPNKSRWDEANEYYWEDIIPSFINGLEKGDIVFAVNDLAFFSPKMNKAKRVTTLKKGIRNLSENLSKRGIRLVFLHGLPFAREAKCDPKELFPQWFQKLRKKEKCEMPNKEQSILRRKPLDETLSTLEREGFVEIVDLFDIFCPKDECSYFGKNQTLLYRDRNAHPSAEAARLSAPLIKSIFEKTTKLK